MASKKIKRHDLIRQVVQDEEASASVLWRRCWTCRPRRYDATSIC